MDDFLLNTYRGNVSTKNISKKNTIKCNFNTKNALTIILKSISNFFNT